MPGALRPSDDLSKKSNVIPSIDRRTEATAEDFKELSDIANNHASLLDELTQAENRNLFYGIFQSKELLEAAFENVEEDGIAIIDPQVGQQIIAKFQNGVWTYTEVTAPIQFYPTKLDRPTTGQTGIWYIVLDEKKAYLWYGDGWLGIGTDGQNGISAYEIAKAYGFVGTEEEWLASLKKGFKDSIEPADAKTNPADNDLFGILDSAANFIAKKLTWSNLKSKLKIHFDTLYSDKRLASLATDLTTNEQDAIKTKLNITDSGTPQTPADYTDMADLFSNQGDQEEGTVYRVGDASAHSEITHTGWAEFKKLATSNAEEEDYELWDQEDVDNEIQVRETKLVNVTTQYIVQPEDYVNKRLVFTSDGNELIDVILNANVATSLDDELQIISAGNHFLNFIEGGSVSLTPTKNCISRTIGIGSVITVIPKTTVNDLVIAGSLQYEGELSSGRPVKTIDAPTYTLELEDRFAWLRFIHSSNTIVTVPNNVFASDDELLGDVEGNGEVSFIAGTDVVLKKVASRTAVYPKDSVIGGKFRDTSSLLIFGQLKPV